jgi:hypothetical protein
MPDPPEARKTFPIVCDQSSWTPSQQKRYGDLREKLHAAVRETRELPNGYEFRFPGEESLCLAAAEFIMLERQCCPFFNFVIEMESGEGHLFLRLTGDEGAKQLLREKLGL